MSLIKTNTITKSIQLTDESVKKYKNATIPDALLQAIYNSIDADSTSIKMYIQNNQGDLFDRTDDESSCKQIIIEDNGSGINFEKLDDVFLPLEDSWKKNKETTPIFHRPYHGCHGSGRFKYLALGENITWETVYEKNNKFYQYSISFNVNSPRKLEITQEAEISGLSTGTKLTITTLTPKFENFCKKSNIKNELISGLLLDLKLANKNLEISIQNNRVILENIIEQEKTFVYQIEDQNKNEIEVNCEIVVWKKDISFVDHKHTFYYNDKNQYVEHKASGIPAGTKFPAHTIIIKSKLFNNYNSFNGNFSPIFSRIEKAYELDAIKLLARVKNTHLSEQLNSIIENPDYPFRKKVQTAIEDAEQTAYNACLYNLLLNDSKVVSEKKTQILKVIFPLLKRTFSGDYILSENIDKILDLSAEESNKYNRMVNRIKLSKIIEKYNQLLHRKTFLQTLETLVFDDTIAQHLEERTQLHKIVAEESWIFGVEFENEDLVTSDKSIVTVIRQLNLRENLYFEDHISDQKLSKIEEYIKQNRDDIDSCLNKIPDLVLCKKEAKENFYKHLIIELKKPTVKIDSECQKQALNVYNGILRASQNNGGVEISDTHQWRYCLVSNVISDTLKPEFTKDGHLEEKSRGNYIIDCLTWREIIDNANRRIDEKLEKINVDICDDDCQDLLNKYKKLFNIAIN